MEQIQISPKELIELMANKDNIVSQGSLGLLLPFNNELLKIYYKEIFNGFYYLDENKLINEIDTHKKVDQQMITMFPDYKDTLIRERKKLKFLESIGLVKATVFCNEYMVGIMLNYYRDYIEVGNAFPQLSALEKKHIIDKMEQYLYFLLSNNIYPSDIKENNVMLRTSDFDIKFIDLDDQETRYEEREYIERFPYIEKDCIDKFKIMCKRLNK
jgi:serine/threonine protein kinase